MAITIYIVKELQCHAANNWEWLGDVATVALELAQLLLGNFCLDFGRFRPEPLDPPFIFLPEIWLPDLHHQENQCQRFPLFQLNVFLRTIFAPSNYITMLSPWDANESQISRCKTWTRISIWRRLSISSEAKIVFPLHNHLDLRRGRFDHSTTIIWISIVS